MAHMQALPLICLTEKYGLWIKLKSVTCLLKLHNGKQQQKQGSICVESVEM